MRVKDSGVGGARREAHGAMRHARREAGDRFSDVMKAPEARKIRYPPEARASERPGDQQRVKDTPMADSPLFDCV